MRAITKKYIVFLAIIAALPPLSTDMYLAALPTIAKEWNATVALITISLTIWFACFSLGLLIAGSLSDKYGRRPVLIYGLCSFIISSILCAVATSPTQLIFFRAIQGISAAFPSSMSMTICRDRFEGSSRKLALAYVGIMISLSPMVAPTLGSLFLLLGDWRFIFFTQATFGAIAFITALKYTETNKDFLKQPLTKIFGRYYHLTKNKPYIKSTLTFGLITGPFYGGIAFSPICYIKIYGLSNFKFSLLFALTALSSIIGAFTFTRIHRFITDKQIITFCYAGGIIAGIGIILIGTQSYYLYFIFSAFFAFICGLSRPVSNNLILSTVETDIGSASSFIIFYQFIIGALCMSYATQTWSSPIIMFGIMMASMSLIGIILWFMVRKYLTEA